MRISDGRPPEGEAHLDIPVPIYHPAVNLSVRPAAPEAKNVYNMTQLTKIRVFCANVCSENVIPFRNTLKYRRVNIWFL